MSKEERKIKYIVLQLGERIEQIDALHAEINSFTKNGEMAAVEWFRYKNREINGKYVIEVVFEKAKQN